MKKNTLITMPGLLAVFILFTACSDLIKEEEGPKGTDGYTVTFNSMGGNYTPSAQNVQENETVHKPADPTREGEIFTGWYRNFALGTLPYEFDTPVVRSFSLYAGWKPEMVTITYVFGNGDNETVDVIKKRRIGNRYDLKTPSKRDGFIFEGWYADSAFATPVTFPKVLNEDTVFYAKWGALADFNFVWTRPNAWSGQTSLLVIDEETGWFFEERGASVYITPISWYTAPVSLSATKATLTLDFNGTVSTLSKQTRTYTPETDSRWTGFWVNNSLTLDLKNDGFGEIIAISGADADDETLALAYAEGDGKLNLLGATSPHYVLLAIPIAGGGLGAGFEQKVVDEKLLGFWEINSSGGKSAYEFKSNGGGTYYALGVEFTFNYVLTEEGDGLGLIIHQTGNGDPYPKYLYEISDDGETLTVQGDEDVIYSKVPTKPDYPSGSGGDTALAFRWNFGSGGAFIEFDQGTARGIFAQYQGGKYTYKIWKAASGDLTFFFPDLGSLPGGESFPYQISTQGNSDRLTFNGNTYQKSIFTPTSGGW
jgi:uncharacterized repeat protein (TIGR02543 family)